MVPIPAILRKKNYDHFVCITHLDTSKRIEAATWAIDQFGDDVDIWVLGKNHEAGFWFKYEKDSMWFIMRWS